MRFQSSWTYLNEPDEAQAVIECSAWIARATGAQLALAEILKPRSSS